MQAQDYQPQQPKAFVLKDKNGNFARIMSRAIPSRIMEHVPACKELGGRVVKDRTATEWPEDENAIPVARPIKRGMFVVGYQNEEGFLLDVGKIRLGVTAVN